MASVHWFKNRSHMLQILFVVIVLYVAASFVVLASATGLIPLLPGAYHNIYILMVFALVSFILTTVMSAYHLSTRLLRRKRKTDHADK